MIKSDSNKFNTGFMEEKLSKQKIRAILKKLEKLAQERPQEEILVELNKILETNPDDINTLNFKADMLYQLGRKEESLQVSQIVLEMDWTNAEANRNVGSIKWDLGKIILATFKDKEELIAIFVHLAVILISIIGGICLSFYFHPQQESISCDSQYRCTIEHTYYQNFKKVEFLQFSPNTIYSPITKTHYRHTNGKHSRAIQDGYMYHHAFYENGQNYDIFKNTIHVHLDETIEEIKENEAQRFEAYMKHPLRQYELRIGEQVTRISDIGGKTGTLLFSIYLLLMFTLFLFFRNADNKKKNK